MKKSTVRLKVRNIDEKQVTNDDLKVSQINLINLIFWLFRNFLLKLATWKFADLTEMNLGSS